MNEISEDVTKCDHQMMELRVMKWLVYVEFMEGARPAV
jgi:hypothetical protein